MNLPPAVLSSIVEAIKSERTELESQSLANRTRFPSLDALQVIRALCNLFHVSFKTISSIVASRRRHIIELVASSLSPEHCDANVAFGWAY